MLPVAFPPPSSLCLFSPFFPIGVIPAGIGVLSGLRILHLNNNKLWGELDRSLIPELTTATNL